MTSGLDLYGHVSDADTGVRQDFDFYETPAWMVRSLLAHHAVRQIATTVFEPCAGNGAIARVLEQAGLITITNDLDTRQPTELHANAGEPAIWQHSRLQDIDWVISNLPFNIAFPILQQAVRCARVGVALLLRKTFTEPTKQRGAWLQEHPPSRQIALPRHSFRGQGSDSVSTDWFIWEKNPDRSLAPFVIDVAAKTRRAA
jgi:hypothetical protein